MNDTFTVSIVVRKRGDSEILIEHTVAVTNTLWDAEGTLLDLTELVDEGTESGRIK